MTIGKLLGLLASIACILAAIGGGYVVYRINQTYDDALARHYFSDELLSPAVCTIHAVVDGGFGGTLDGIGYVDGNNLYIHTVSVNGSKRLETFVISNRQEYYVWNAGNTDGLIFTHDQISGFDIYQRAAVCSPQWISNQSVYQLPAGVSFTPQASRQ